MSSNPPFIPVAQPSITDREGELAKLAALTAFGADHYKFNATFETMFAEYVGVDHAASLPHATAGLHLALAAAGVGPGDEVIGPDITWIASMAPVDYVGATPVFVDILPDTWCIDPDAVAKAISPRTKAIIGVDLYGSMCDWAALRTLASKHGLFLLQDAAEAFGSVYQGERAGRQGDAAAFSFHGSKTLSTGEGGMVVTSDSQLFERMQKLRDHGRPPGDRFFQNDEVAFKYKMSAVQAALGIAQMERADGLISRKREIFGWYAERLHDVPDLALNVEPPGIENSYWMVTAVPGRSYGLTKFDLQSRLRERSIDSRPFFSRLSQLPAYARRNEAKRALPQVLKGQQAADCGVNLPSGYNLVETDVERICAELVGILNGSRTSGEKYAGS